MEGEKTEFDNAELLALQRIDETCMQLQQQGNYLEALECMERGLVLRQHFFGAESEEVWRACRTVGEMCNLLAMTYLQQEDFAMVLELLKKAEILTERDEKGKAVTYNNLACYYRRQGKLHAALQYLQKALKIESRLQEVENPADTHLNACAVLSQLGRHASALEHAQSSMILLQEELFHGDGDPKPDRVAVLGIAYHNIGVEQEFLKKYEQSITSYRKGVEVAEQYLGPKHAITITLRNSLVAAKRAVGTKNPEAARLGAKRTGKGRTRTRRTFGGGGRGAKTQAKMRSTGGQQHKEFSGSAYIPPSPMNDLSKEEPVQEDLEEDAPVDEYIAEQDGKQDSEGAEPEDLPVNELSISDEGNFGGEEIVESSRDAKGASAEGKDGERPSQLSDSYANDEEPFHSDEDIGVENAEDGHDLERSTRDLLSPRPPSSEQGKGEDGESFLESNDPEQSPSQDKQQELEDGSIEL
mmetsp:Transcript_28780/g.37795  ORF Transcript_28780/g.37795 Transcript_28780/m.37795 type:complete len:470 (-) Transcript_28780:456-1865(-)